MIKNFTTPCFIRKNTLELRKKLEELGYVLHGHIDIDINDNYLYVIKNGVYFTLDFEISNRHNLIDCGENEQLFLALAALRDDSDKFQWFVRDEPHETYSKFTLCESDDWDSDFYSWSNDDDIFPYMYHKATPEELIEYFNKQ